MKSAFIIKSLAAAGVLTALGACSIIYKTTGHVIASLSEDMTVPYMLKQDDMQLACNSFSLAGLIESFDDVGTDIRELGAVLYSIGGLCTQMESLEYEMDYHLAVQAGDGKAAQDALTMQKRSSQQASKNYYRSYKYTIDFFEATENECPDFDNDFQELAWLLGLQSGLLSLLSDSVADLSVGVPRNIPAKAERWIGCIDNSKWWGAPNSLKAAIWTTLPSVAPEGANAQSTLVQSQNLSLERGVRIGYAFAAITALGQGNTEQAKQVIRQFAQTTENGFIPDQEFKMVDEISERLILSVSDTIWGKEEGIHTPFGSLGSFAGDVQKEEVLDFDIDDLL